jgi:CBS domain-containing protein
VRLEVASRRGHAAEAIVTYAAEVDADLIVIGATGHERPWSLTAGGTARRIANEAGCAVLVVRPPIQAQRVGDVMTRYVTSISLDAPLVRVVDQLIRRRVKALPVVDGEQHVLGIVTGGDLLRRGDLGLRLSLRQVLNLAELGAQMSRLAGSGRTARSVMTSCPRTITADAGLDAAIYLLVHHGIKRLPVVDADGRLVGIVSRSDLLRLIAAVPSAIALESTPLATARIVRDIMTPHVPTISPDASADEVLSGILASPFRRVVVIDAERRVLGLVTDRAILAHAEPASRAGLFARLTGWAAPPAPVYHEPLIAALLMEREVITIPDQASLAETARQFLAHRIKRLIVIDAEGRLAGLVDRRVLFQTVAGLAEHANKPREV